MKIDKEELIKLLKEYRENKSKLELRKIEKKRLEEDLRELKTETEADNNMSTAYGTNSDIRSKNSIASKTENIVIHKEAERKRIIKEIKDLKKVIKETEELVKQADIRLNSLYYKEREILTAYYVDNREADEIGRNLYFQLYNRTCTADNIYRIVKKATERIINL